MNIAELDIMEILGSILHWFHYRVEGWLLEGELVCFWSVQMVNGGFWHNLTTFNKFLRSFWWILFLAGMNYDKKGNWAIFFIIVCTSFGLNIDKPYGRHKGLGIFFSVIRDYFRLKWFIQVSIINYRRCNFITFIHVCFLQEHKSKQCHLLTVCNVHVLQYFGLIS